MSPKLSFALLALLVLTTPARAGDVTTRHKFALENYDLGDYPAAVKQLEEALQEAAGDRAALVQTHMLLGALHANGTKDEGKAVEHFTAALAIDPAATVDPRFDNEVTATALAKARESLRPKVKKADCATLRGIAHTALPGAEAGVTAEIAAQIGKSLAEYPVSLFYQPAGTAEFVEVKMAPANGCDYVGAIPAEAVAGGELKYYIAAKNATGRVVATKGNASTPFIVPVATLSVVVPGEAAGEGGEAVEQEIPDALTQPRRPAPRGSGCAGCNTGNNTSAATSGLLLLGLALLVGTRRRR